MQHQRTPTATRAAGVSASLLLGGVAVFHVALGLGAPWGANAYGGRAETRVGVLPPGYRITSLAAAPLLSLAAWVLLARVGVAGRGRVPRVVVDRATWALVVLLAVNTVGNLASRSTIERWGLGTVTAVAAALAWRVAHAAPQSMSTRESAFTRREAP